MINEQERIFLELITKAQQGYKDIEAREDAVILDFFRPMSIAFDEVA